MKTLELMTFGMMIALGALARGITYSDYEFTKQAELIVQGEVIECHTNGPYKLKVVRVLKGKCPRDTLDLPFRYFYAQSTEQEELSLSKKETGVFFLRYTRNGDCDGIYKMQLIRLGGDTPKNRDRLPYSEGYEIFEGWLGAQKRGTERELKAFGDSIMKTAEALNSHTNSPDARFRESVLSTLKTFEMRTPKAGKTKAKSAGEI